jgi:hypothetical protein
MHPSVAAVLWLDFAVLRPSWFFENASSDGAVCFDRVESVSTPERDDLFGGTINHDVGGPVINVKLR